MIIEQQGERPALLVRAVVQYDRASPGDPELFFFASRIRHTRFSHDWSSDVCSSDLDCLWIPGPQASPASRNDVSTEPQRTEEVRRSEERRVGKECKSRWSPQHYK